jgi:hypothetical protein
MEATLEADATLRVEELAHGDGRVQDVLLVAQVDRVGVEWREPRWEDQLVVHVHVRE